MRRPAGLALALSVSIAAVTFAQAEAGAGFDAKSLSCWDCHGPQVHDFLQTRHSAALASDGRRDETSLCGACHGEVTAHAEASRPQEVPVQYRFAGPASEDAARDQARCLPCHEKGRRPIPADGHHAMGEVGCLKCHSGMGKGGWPGLRKAPEAELCGACHAEALAPFRSGHRTDRAGALCTFCHDPHARMAPLLARECADCHRAYAYPKPFEHPPVVEGCVGCHDPHGSMERFLLRDSRPPLCLGCHSQIEAFHRIDSPQSAYRLYEGCQNCHPRIHGSDARGGHRFQR